MTIKHRQQFDIAGTPTPFGTFEVLAITAGEGNGWKFSAETLKKSLPLWENAECFIDHSFWGHSLRDLAGVFSAPSWDEGAQGIALSLQPMGPSAPLLVEIGRQMLAEKDLHPKVGFSADLTFTSKGKDVQEILKIYSVDLVYNPARGGAFKRALNAIGWDSPITIGAIQPIVGAVHQSPSVGAIHELPIHEPPHRKDNPMPEPVATPAPDSEQAAIAEHAVSIRALLQEQERVRADMEAAKKVRAEMCGHLLESALAASNLPKPMQESVRRQFSGRIYEPAELNQAIEDARNLVSELTGALTVQGPGRIHGLFSSEDQLQAAVDDLLEAPRDKAAEGLKVAKLSGIRELYLMLTGDVELHGGFDRSRIQLATTADFTGIIKNALNKIVVNKWAELGAAGYDWWKAISTVEHFNSINTITGTLVGTVGALPAVAEGAEYTELPIGDSPETASFVKYGGYIPLTLELIDRDETRKLKAYPRELAIGGLRKISALVAAIFTANSGVGPTMADGGALFNNTAVTTAGGHANLLTTALDANQWEVVSTAVYNQPLLIKNAAGLIGTGPKMAVNPRYLLVPRALQLTAMKILYPSLENKANIYSENLQRGRPGDVITVPEWTDATDWAAVVDPVIAPAIHIGERFGIMPEIFIAGDEQSPAVFMNDEHRLKARHFLAVWVNDYRPLHKSNVAG